VADVTTKDKLYFAGFFDGEGCVAIYSKRNKYVVCLTNTDVRPLRRASILWGGTVTTQSKNGRKGALQDLWRWSLYGHNSLEFLRDIRPYTMIKTEQIDCYLDAMNVVPMLGYNRPEGAAEIIDEAIVTLCLLKRGA